MDYFLTDDPYEIYDGNVEARRKLQAIIGDNPHNFNSDNNRLAAPPVRPALPVLSEIQAPTLVAVGEYDIPDVHAHAGAIEAGISGARRVVIRDCGHLVPLEKPKELADAITTFLSEAGFYDALEGEGVDAAVALCLDLLKGNPDVVPVAENRLNATGYQYLLAGDATTAVKLFELMVAVYPESANAYDSYGEALLASGDTSGAVVNYEKSLNLNPNNANATTVLERIKNQD
jgi:tetratricopeptide (TPR) repeat protein